MLLRPDDRHRAGQAPTTIGLMTSRHRRSIITENTRSPTLRAAPENSESRVISSSSVGTGGHTLRSPLSLLIPGFHAVALADSRAVRSKNICCPDWD
jgi:hypothetical protein